MVSNNFYILVEHSGLIYCDMLTGGHSAGKDFYDALRKDPDFKKSPFLLFCGMPEQAGLPNDPEQRLWVL